MENNNLSDNFKKDFKKATKFKARKFNNNLIIRFYNSNNKIINNYMYIVTLKNLTNFLINDYKLRLSEDLILSKLFIIDKLENGRIIYIKD